MSTFCGCCNTILFTLWLTIFHVKIGSITADRGACGNAASLSEMHSNHDLNTYAICGLQSAPLCSSSTAFENDNDTASDNGTHSDASSTSYEYDCAALDFYAYTNTDVHVCGCMDSHIVADIVVLIDATNFTNDYAWYFMSTSWLKLWYYDIVRHQPLLNITYVYYGSNVEFIKRGVPTSFFGNWTLPTVFVDDTTPNVCNAFQTAAEILSLNRHNQTATTRKKILISFSNATPDIPNQNSACSSHDGVNISLDDVDIFALKTSAFVDMSAVEAEYGAFDACVNMLSDAQYSANWATYFDENENAFQANLDVYNYLNLMVSAVSDFVCQRGEVCRYVRYSQSDFDSDEQEEEESVCRFSCVDDDYSCVENANDSLTYFIVDAYSGSQPLPVSHADANGICRQYFGTSLASVSSAVDQLQILKVMDFFGASECWIGLNDTEAVFELDGADYLQWMDGAIHSFSRLSDTVANSTGCVSISSSTGDWSMSDCDEVVMNCLICNVVDEPAVSVANDKYRVLQSTQPKTRDEADAYCQQHYATHLSTIQSDLDQNDMQHVLKLMRFVLDESDDANASNASDSGSAYAWIGDTLYFTYNDCNDVSEAVVQDVWMDSSTYEFTMLDYAAIAQPTCAPTVEPTVSPIDSLATTATTSTTTTTNGSAINDIAFELPLETTKSPTINPTVAPTMQNRKHVSVSVDDGAWQPQDENETLHSFSCNVMDRTQYAIQSDDYYVFHGIAKTWIEADIYCESIFGTKLSTIYESFDQNEILALRDTLRNSKNASSGNDDDDEWDLWIGMKLDDGQFSQSHIEWTDGSRSNFSHLNSGCLVILHDADADADEMTTEQSWIIDACSDVHSTWSCNTFVPTPYPSMPPTLTPTEIFVQLSYADLALQEVQRDPFRTFYVALVTISVIFTILAFFHTKNLFCCCRCCCSVKYMDDAKWTAVLIFGLNIWDFLSDCSFAYNINDRMSILFILSASFIVVPWLCNICFLFIFRRQYSRNFDTSKWFREHAYKLVLITMISGSASASINLMNSNIFGLSLFGMGLTKIQLIETSKFKIILQTCLENIPQICFTSYFLVVAEGINDFAVMSLLSSTLSIILTVVITIIFTIDPLNDEYIELTLKYRQPLERTVEEDELEKEVLVRFGFHKRLARSLAFSFGLTPNLVFVDRHKYNTNNQTITLLVSINTTKSKNTHKRMESQQQQQQQQREQEEQQQRTTRDDADAEADEEERSPLTVNRQRSRVVSNALHRDSITRKIINDMNSKKASAMVYNILDTIKANHFAHLFYQINMIPLSKNDNKKLPFSKKIKLDMSSITTDFTALGGANMMSDSLLRNQSQLSSENLGGAINDNDQDEILNIPGLGSGLPPRPLSNTVNEIEMQPSESTRL